MLITVWAYRVNPLIGHFTVVYYVTWPWIVSEAEGDLVLIQTSLLFICRLCCSYVTSLHLHMKSSEVCMTQGHPQPRF